MARNRVEITISGNAAGAVGAFGAADSAAAKLGRNYQRVGGNLVQAGKTLTAGITLPVVALAAGAITSSIKFEDAFAGVRKTVDATEPQFRKLEQGIRNMAMQLPASRESIAGVAEAAGQLGIKTENILGFSRVMVDLGETTNVSANSAAEALARLANITQMPQTEFDRLGATIVDLGNKGAATESEIIDMGLRIAGAGHQIGLSEAQILGFAESLSSVGIEAEAGGSAISRVFVEIANSVATGGEKLDQFASVAGVSATDFKTAFETDAAGAVISFIEGLGKIDDAGGNVFKTLDDLSLGNVRVRDALLRAAGAGDLFRESQVTANEAWRENNALTDEAAKRYETTGSQLKILWNRLGDAALTLGDALVPALMSAVNAGEPLIGMAARIAEGFSSLPESAQTGVLAFAGLAAAVGPVLIVAGSLIRAFGDIKVAMSSVQVGAFSTNLAKGGLALGAFMLAAQLVGPQLTEMTGSAEIAGAGLGALTGLTFGPWGAVVGGVLGAVAGHFGVLGDDAAAAADKARQAMDRLTDSLLVQQSAVNESSVNQLTADWRAVGERANEALPALDKAGLSLEDLNRQLAGGPVVMDNWIQGAINAAAAGGATDTELSHLAFTLSELGPKWIEANANASQMADVANNAAFFVGQFDNNMQSLSDSVLLNAQHFAMHGTVQAGAREQIVNAGIAAVQAGTQLREEGAAVEYVNGVLGTHAGQLVDQVNQITGGNIPATIEHTSALLGIPPEMFTNVHTTADIAAVIAQHFIDKVNAIPPTARTDATFGGDTGPIDTWIGRINAIPRNISIAARFTAVGGLPFNYDGGPIPGPTSQAVPFIGHGGEYVLSADVVNRIKQGRPSRGADVAGGMVGGGGGGVALTVNLNGPIFGGDKKRVAKELVREIHTELVHLRRSGELGLN